MGILTYVLKEADADSTVWYIRVLPPLAHTLHPVLLSSKCKL